MTVSVASRLRDAFGAGRFQQQAALAPFTTFKVGGPAEFLLTLERGEDVCRALGIGREAGIPVTVLGGGSNVLVSDRGLPGLVLRIRGGDVHQSGPGVITADAGLTMNGLVRWTLARGLAGLEAWAGTPGTVGGAIFGNAHFQGRNISDLVERVAIVGHGGRVEDVAADTMEFAYDYSRLHRTGEVVVAVEFRVFPGEPGILRATARDSLAYRKRTQPLAMPSAGCIFQNPDRVRDHVPDGIPCSAGALVDRAGLKGAREGSARVSPTHGNFIVNEGGATAAQVRALIDRCKQEVLRQFGVELREEVVCLGFAADGMHGRVRESQEG